MRSGWSFGVSKWKSQVSLPWPTRTSTSIPAGAVRPVRALDPVSERAELVGGEGVGVTHVDQFEAGERAVRPRDQFAREQSGDAAAVLDASGHGGRFRPRTHRCVARSPSASSRVTTM